MAKVKFSALVSEMRNKLNGSVFSKNRAGNYLRNKVTPVNPQTTAQTLVRGIFASLSAQWRTLPQTEQNAWNAASANFPVVDIFGDTKYLSGQQLFIRLNANLAQAGGGALTSPPSPSLAPTPGLLSVTADASTPEVELTFTEAAVPGTVTLIVWATPQVSPGKSFVKNLYRSLGPQVITTNTLDIATAYEARFGLLTPGQKLFVKCVYINNASGQQSVPATEFTVIVP